MRFKADIVWALALVVELYYYLKFRKLVKYYRHLLKLANLPIFTASQIKYGLKTGILKAGEFVACSGILKTYPANRLKSLLNKAVDVAFSELSVEKVFEIGEKRNSVTKNLRSAFTGILKLESGGNSIPIFQTLKTKFLSVKCYEKTVSYNQKMFNLGWFFSLFLKTPTRLVLNNYTEFVIPDSSEVTLLSQVSEQGELYRPLIMGPNMKRIQYYLTSKISELTLTKGLTLLVILTTIAMWSLVKTQYLQRGPKKCQGKVEKIVVKQLTCSMCSSNISNIIVRPCGHLAVCTDCWSKDQPSTKECLECKGQSLGVDLVYPC